jgi:hypothetical protein
MKAYTGRVGKDLPILTLTQSGLSVGRLGCFTHGNPLRGLK